MTCPSPSTAVWEATAAGTPLSLSEALPSEAAPRRLLSPAATTAGVVGIGVARTRSDRAGILVVEGSLREAKRPRTAGSPLREAR